MESLAPRRFFPGRSVAPRARGGSSPGALLTARRSLSAMLLAVTAWAAGCASAPRPAIEPAFAARTYTPIRIALLPPDVFMIRDQVGDNDPAQSEALRQQVFGELVKFATEAFRQRGYDLNLSARWDGVVGQDGSLLVSRDELGWMANSVLQFANGPGGGRQGTLTPPEFVAPEMAAKIGWATQSDALLYVNLKGVASTDGKRTAQVVGGVLIIAVVALIVLALLAQSKGGGNNSGKGLASGGGGGRSVSAPAMRGAPGGAPAPRPSFGGAGSGMVRGAPPAGRGLGPVRSPGRVYGGGGPRVGIGVGLYVPLGVPAQTTVDSPAYTHDGSVVHDDEWFGGDQLYLSMTLVNSADGRVLWHVREDLDFDADDPADIKAMVERVVASIPLRGDLTDASHPRSTAPTAGKP